MDRLFQIDWNAVFVPATPLAEVVLRGTAVYLLLFVFMRFVLKRQMGAIGVTDLLVVVVIADAAQNAMGSEYRSVTEGAVLVGTIVFWNFALDWLGFHFPRFERVVRPSPLLLVKDGRMLRRNMRKELITEEELMSELRQHGIEDVADVKEVYIEGDGSISVVPKEPKEPKEPTKKKAAL